MGGVRLRWVWVGAACALPVGVHGQCTVPALQLDANGVLDGACQQGQTLADAATCAVTCAPGYTLSGAQPSCAGTTFNPGSIVCAGNPCQTDPVITGIDGAASACEGLTHGAACEFACEVGLAPSGTARCNAGEYDAATCDEIDACVNNPCSYPDGETCEDVLGGPDSADGRTCSDNTCSGESVGSLALLGYVAATPTGTTVAGLGEIDCASGYMRGDTEIAPNARCRAGDSVDTPVQFEFEGCVEAACSGIPSFLAGFDLTGVELPTRPEHPAVTDLSACLPNRLPGGSVPLTVRCDAHGNYQQDNPGPDDHVCAPCVVVENAAVEACTYEIPDVPPIGTPPLTEEATRARIDLCATVDISSSDASADESACVSAGGGGICVYLSEATYTCSTQTDTRVSACKQGYYRAPGLPDVPETVNTIESTNDRCSPCTVVQNRAGYSISSCTTAYDTRVSYCAPEFYRSQGVTERCDGETEGDETDDACEALVLDGQPVTCRSAPAPASPCFHTEGTPDSCMPCGRVSDALEGAVQNCTNANDTRVESCAPGYVHVRGASGTPPEPDTCWSTPPSVMLTYDGNYASITATAAAYSSFQTFFRNELSDALSIEKERVVVTSVAQGSIVVYFYILAAQASAPSDERTTDEAYSYLVTLAASGQLCNNRSLSTRCPFVLTIPFVGVVEAY